MEELRFDSVIKLNNGVEMPLVGYSTELVGMTAYDDITRSEIIGEAIAAGYRRFEATESYNTLRALGKAIRKSGVPREAFFLSCKPAIWDVRDYRNYYAFEEIIAQLETDYIDLFSVTWPHPRVYLENLGDWQRKAWVRFQDVYAEGRARAIGICNYRVHHMEKLLADPETKVIPAVNQDQFTPLYRNDAVRDFCVEKGIAFGAINEEDLTVKPVKPHYTEYANLGYQKPGYYDRSEMLRGVGEAHNKSVQQVLHRWVLQHGAMLTVKAVDRPDMEAERDVFDFALSAGDMAAIDAVNLDYRSGYDPDHIDF